MGNGTNGSDSWATEPIAIIGMSCKFAGSASSAEKLWDMLAAGEDAWSEIPTSRFDVRGTHHPNHEKIGTTHAKGAHFMNEDVGLFDAAFFNFSAEMASAMDPQFRLQLESAYEALENGQLFQMQVSFSPDKKEIIAGSNTSVFTGVFSHDYHEGLIRDEDQLPRFLPIGTFSAMSSNRLSHFFDLRGASMTVDTGCSTTLVALHQAVKSLRNREADMSIVGGSNLLLTSDMFKVFGSLGMLSPDGRSYAFDSRANGYGRGEGVATVVIKRLNDALACGDPVRALIRETCLNQDGKTDTITTPSQTAQEDLMQECYRRAGLDPRDTQYFEAHGTGTPTGDPIEARAIATVFGGPDRATETLRIGSIKTNIGHTEAVSGLASLIKVILALERRHIPPSINYQTPNPKLALDKWNLAVATGLHPWPSVAPGRPRRASVNNFGYGGSNAHVIIEGVDEIEPLRPTSITNNDRVHGQSAVLIVSARDEGACQRMVSNLVTYLQDGAHVEDHFLLLRNLAYTLGERRSIYPWVAVNQVHLHQANNGLESVIQSLESPKFTPVRALTRRPRIGMVFTGQGAQWHAMGRELIDWYPVYNTSLEEAEHHLRAIGAEWSLLEELQRSTQTSRVNTTELSIPVCVALQIALVQLLRSWGITPVAVTSHSSGEIAAAYTAGALTMRQAMVVAFYRAKLAADPNFCAKGEKGTMLAVGVGLDQATTYIKRLLSSGKVVVACINSPQSVTIAGDMSAVEEMELLCQQESVFVRRLRVDTGYHSHHMQPIAGPYLNFLQKHMRSEDINDDNDDEAPEVAFSSPVTGGRVTGVKQISSPQHWVRSLLQPVRFVEAFTDMVVGCIHGGGEGSNIDVVIEVGPHTALAAPIREILSLPEFESLDLPYLGCLLRNEDAVDTMRSTAMNLLREGQPLNMHSINFPRDDTNLRVIINLPSYSWNHSHKHWQESRMNRAIRARKQQPHDLIGSIAPGINPEAVVWRNILRIAELPWLRDHQVQNNIVYPGAGYVCQAIEAVRQLVGIQDTAYKDIDGYRLRDVELPAALVVPDNTEGIEIHTTLRQVSDRDIGARGWNQFDIWSVTIDSKWTLHAKGLIIVDFEGSAVYTSRLSKRPLSSYKRRIDPQDMFTSLRSQGIYHGPKFQNTTAIEQDGRERRSISYISIAETAATNELADDFVLHPTTLDSVILSAYSALPGAGALEDDAKIPQSIQSLRVSSRISNQAGNAFCCHTSLLHANAQNLQADVLVIDNQAHESVLEMKGLVCRSMGRGGTLIDDEPMEGEQEVCSKVKWAPDMSMRQMRVLSKIRRELSRPAESIDRELVIRLRRVCIYFCHVALQGLTTQDLSQLEPHHVKFHTWMRHHMILAATKQLGPDSDTWVLDETQERDRQIALAAEQSVEGEMVCRLGPLLLPMLRGERLPLEVMMEGRLLYRYYADAIRMAPSLTQLAGVLRKIVHKNPRARILEIGGGTGGATRHMLKALGTVKEGGPLAACWHFTDISSGFFEAARTEFTAWADILEFDRLDIEKDPAAQGFELASYDIVVACEVLHATKNMTRTMTNVRSLMKPGATLLMMETTQDQVDIQFTFGLLPGWWLSEEPEPQSSPSLTIPFCDSVLKSAGFTGVDLEIRDCESEDMYSISVIMSTTEMGPSTPKGQPFSDDIVLVTSKLAPPPTGSLDVLKASIQALPNGPGRISIASLEDTIDGSEYSGKICVFLGEMGQPILHNMDRFRFQAIRDMVNSCQGVLWVTVNGGVECGDPSASLSHGLLRTLRNEYVGRRYAYLDLEAVPAEGAWPSSILCTISRVLGLAFGHHVEDPLTTDFEYAERDGVLLVPRLYKDPAHSSLCVLRTPSDPQEHTSAVQTEPFFQGDRPLRLEVGTAGLLDTLAFGDHPIGLDALPGSRSVEIEPRAYGLNFRDVMVAMGQLREHVMGLECSGIIARLGSEAQDHGFKIGDRVMALLLGPFASRVQTNWHGVVHIPDGISFEEAASLPMIFSTAYVSLVDVANLRPGQSVLIHSAAGGVGQAAIMLAKHFGAGDIFVTVGSPKKRRFLVDEYGIPDAHIFSNRNASFGPAIMAATGGRGVDVVLNSLAGPLLQASFDVVAPFGHLVEIGKKDLEGNSLLEMGTFSRVASYTSVDMMALLRHRGSDINRALAEISRFVQQRIISPARPVTAYPMADVAKAFRLLQTGKHTGKIVLTTKPDEKVKVRPLAAATVRLKDDASYLLVGGVGGLGRSIAHWLAGHGGKNLIILSRSAGDVEKTGAFIDELSEMGCRVTAISCNISIAGELVKALRTCEAKGLPPVRGVIQGAMALKDSVFEQMTWDDWQTCIQPKIYGTWNLHVEWSRPGSLDFFVMLSSFSGILGIVSQANYAAGSTYQDAMAYWRQGRGLPGIAIDLGAVKGVGYVAETAGVADRMRKTGETLMLEEGTVLQALQSAILEPLGHPQLLLGLNTGSGPQWDPQGKSQMSRDARFLPLRFRDSRLQKGRDTSSEVPGVQTLASQLAEASSRDEAAKFVGEAIGAKLASIFMIPATEIDLAQSPALYGIDSLVAVELRNMLAMQAGAEVSIFTIMQSLTLAALALEVAVKSSYIKAA
ncbi:hypothetical protein F5Y19DRAFT_483291 [Xylariaceae sp. FL1651]|nr:hypothetical protein F5Y19DRAFT_483291 [Xylariaceae sp. FL1651]